VASLQASNSGLTEKQPAAATAGAGAAPLTRIRFSRDDLLLTRFAEAPAPLVEASIGLLEMRRRPAVLSRWAVRARRAFPVTARPLLDLIPPSLPSPTFVDPPVPDLEEGLEIVRATPAWEVAEQVAECWRGPARPPPWLRALAGGDPEAREIVVRALRDFYFACVAPCWPQIVAAFRADVAERIGALATGGLAEVLGTLHETLAWRDNSLERSWRTGDCTLDGQGVQLMPSKLWTGPPLFADHPPRAGGNVLIYAARATLSADEASQSHNLASLLGQTRAAVLRALRTPRSTTELAACVGTSAPSASEHATALRASGLVQTVRRGRGVNHSLTPLGRSLLDGNLNAH
jgi:DNA-binding transcriptional ArsR family regulator